MKKTTQQFADESVRRALDLAFHATGAALAASGPGVRTDTVLRDPSAAVRMYLERAERE